MKVHFSQKSRRALLDYIRQYQEFLVKDFYDTGLISESSIRERYIQEWWDLADKITLHIESLLLRKIVAYEVMENGHFLTVTRIWPRLAFIEFIEKDDDRYVVTMKLFRK